ncbi:MAG: hypothetical protein JWN93_379 [Hyphomicrobiales bacterium]|nr:hypothetical protein [Hyphomicrobiales bacterium]
MSDSLHTGQQAQDDDDAASARRAVRVMWAGVALMSLAGVLMWAKFGPTMFVDLATAVLNCL